MKGVELSVGKRSKVASCACKSRSKCMQIYAKWSSSIVFDGEVSEATCRELRKQCETSCLLRRTVNLTNFCFELDSLDSLDCFLNKISLSLFWHVLRPTLRARSLVKAKRVGKFCHVGLGNGCE